MTQVSFDNERARLESALDAIEKIITDTENNSTTLVSGVTIKTLKGLKADLQASLIASGSTTYSKTKVDSTFISKSQLNADALTLADLSYLQSVLSSLSVNLVTKPVISITKNAVQSSEDPGVSASGSITAFANNNPTINYEWEFPDGTVLVGNSPSWSVPDSLNTGSYQIKCAAVDAYGNRSEPNFVSISVTQNLPPSITGYTFKLASDNSSVTQLMEETDYTLTVNGIDPEGASITYSVAESSSSSLGVTFTQVSSNVFSFTTPTVTADTPLSISLTVDDGLRQATLEISILVINRANQAATIDDIQLYESSSNTWLSLKNDSGTYKIRDVTPVQVIAADIDADPITYKVNYTPSNTGEYIVPENPSFRHLFNFHEISLNGDSIVKQGNVVSSISTYSAYGNGNFAAHYIGINNPDPEIIMHDNTIINGIVSNVYPLDPYTKVSALEVNSPYYSYFVFRNNQCNVNNCFFQVTKRYTSLGSLYGAYIAGITSKNATLCKLKSYSSNGKRYFSADYYGSVSPKKSDIEFKVNEWYDIVFALVDKKLYVYINKQLAFYFDISAYFTGMDDYRSFTSIDFDAGGDFNNTQQYAQIAVAPSTAYINANIYKNVNFLEDFPALWFSSNTDTETGLLPNSTIQVPPENNNAVFNDASNNRLYAPTSGSGYSLLAATENFNTSSFSKHVIIPITGRLPITNTGFKCYFGLIDSSVDISGSVPSYTDTTINSIFFVFDYASGTDLKVYKNGVLQTLSTPYNVINSINNWRMNSTDEHLVELALTIQANRLKLYFHNNYGNPAIDENLNYIVSSNTFKFVCYMDAATTDENTYLDIGLGKNFNFYKKGVYLNQAGLNSFISTKNKFIYIPHKPTSNTTVDITPAFSVTDGINGYSSVTFTPSLTTEVNGYDKYPTPIMVTPLNLSSSSIFKISDPYYDNVQNKAYYSAYLDDGINGIYTIYEADLDNPINSYTVDDVTASASITAIPFFAYKVLSNKWIGLFKRNGEIVIMTSTGYNSSNLKSMSLNSNESSYLHTIGAIFYNNAVYIHTVERIIKYNTTTDNVDAAWTLSDTTNYKIYDIGSLITRSTDPLVVAIKKVGTPSKLYPIFTNSAFSTVNIGNGGQGVLFGNEPTHLSNYNSLNISVRSDNSSIIERIIINAADGSSYAIYSNGLSTLATGHSYYKGNGKNLKNFQVSVIDNDNIITLSSFARNELTTGSTDQAIVSVNDLSANSLSIKTVYANNVNNNPTYDMSTYGNSPWFNLKLLDTNTIYPDNPIVSITIPSARFSNSYPTETSVIMETLFNKNIGVQEIILNGMANHYMYIDNSTTNPIVNDTVNSSDVLTGTEFTFVSTTNPTLTAISSSSPTTYNEFIETIKIGGYKA
jgi:hypothetical protein